MDSYMIVLRVIHIVAGAFWTGASLLITGFITPAVRASGPEGGRFMQRLTGQTRLPTFMSLASVLTVLSGLLLYWRVSGGLRAGWIMSGSGLVLTVSSAVGLLESVLGFLTNRPAAERMAAVARGIQSAGGPPTAAQAAEMQALQQRLSSAGVRSAVVLLVVLIGMSAARYITLR